MLNLVLKDILIQKKYLLVSVLYALLFSLFFKANPHMVFTMVPMMIAYTLIMNACGFDDKNKCEIMLNSLPINKSSVVISKYLSTILFIFIGVLLAFIFTTILNFAGIFHINRLMNFQDVFGVSIGTLLMSCIFFPFNFKFGYHKSRYILLASFFLVFAALPILINNVAKSPINLITYLNTQPDWLVATFMVVIVAILFLISLLLSIKFYVNKDL